MAMTWRERAAFEKIVDQLRVEDPALELAGYADQHTWRLRRTLGAGAVLLFVGCGYLATRHPLFLKPWTQRSNDASGPDPGRRREPVAEKVQQRRGRWWRSRG